MSASRDPEVPLVSDLAARATAARAPYCPPGWTMETVEKQLAEAHADMHKLDQKRVRLDERIGWLARLKVLWDNRVDEADMSPAKRRCEDKFEEGVVEPEESPAKKKRKDKKKSSSPMS